MVAGGGGKLSRPSSESPASTTSSAVEEVVGASSGSLYTTTRSLRRLRPRPTATRPTTQAPEQQKHRPKAAMSAMEVAEEAGAERDRNDTRPSGTVMLYDTVRVGDDERVMVRE